MGEQGQWLSLSIRIYSVHIPGMFSVTEEQAAAIRQAYEQSGELAAMVELRRHFRGITDNENASD